MGNNQNFEFIDGKMVDISQLSIEQLKKEKEKIDNQIEELFRQIDAQLEIEESI